MSEQPQSFENHARIVPAYHWWATALLVLPTLYFLYAAVRDFYSVERTATALFAIGVLIAALFARVFPLRAQDRVIRLEERLRMERLLPDDLKARVDQLTIDQIVGLRFASDGELADLVRRVLDGEITGRAEIKQAIQSWRPDHLRV